MELGKISLPRQQSGRGGNSLSARLRVALAARGWTTGPEPQVRFGQQLLPGLASVGPSQADGAGPERRRAAELLERRFTYFGQTVSFPERVDWQAPGVSNAWRFALNSLDDLYALGVAATTTPDPAERRACYDAAIQLVQEWVDGVRPGTGSGWSIPSLARRIPNLLYVSAFFAPELRNDPTARGAVMRAAYVQSESLAARIAAHPADVWSIAGGRALFLAGRVFDGLDARAWVDQATQLLWGQLREQVNDDGGHVDRSPAKQALVLAQYLEVFALLQASRDEVPIWGRKRVKGMADFLARVSHPDGTLPLFHAAGVAAPRPVGELLAAAAALLQDPGLAAPGDLPGVWPVLLLGESGKRVYGQLPRQRVGGESRALRRTGYYVLAGAPGDAMVIDGGDVPADGDASLLGYELALGGHPLLVHGGFEPDDRSPWRTWFRSADAHNLPRVLGRPTTPAVAPAATEVAWIARDGLVYFAAAREQIVPGVSQRRRVICAPGQFWIVVDQLWGEGAGQVESLVHLHPDVDVRAICHGHPSLWIDRGETTSAQLVFAGVESVSLLEGVDDAGGRQGWHATPSRPRASAPTVVLRAAGALPAVLGYAVLPHTEAAAVLDLEHDAFEVRVRLQVGDRRWAITALADDVALTTRHA